MNQTTKNSRVLPVSSKRNLLQTFSIKSQLKLANFFANFERPTTNETGLLSKGPLNLLHLCCVDYDGDIFTTSWVKVNSVTLKPKTVIEYVRYEDGTPQFAIFNYLLFLKEKNVLCLQELLDFGFDCHYHPYAVKLNNTFLSLNLDPDWSDKFFYIQKINKSLKMVNYYI